MPRSGGKVGSAQTAVTEVGVGTTVGVSTGALVGVEVGASVGVTVGVAVGAAVGVAVGATGVVTGGWLAGAGVGVAMLIVVQPARIRVRPITAAMRLKRKSPTVGVRR